MPELEKVPKNQSINLNQTRRPKMMMENSVLPRDQNFDDLLKNFKLLERPGNTGARKFEN